ncbi:hypothetical protein E2C01_012071 [Portunus trituberculatus]|uniref:Uncharacterized protein n=1 Tax=Portunus trituberculatus TaxID=210409 RepID=A0A5B7DCZ0_PORTR|nr:hypothetical protein [Portunus trituberculatus]
MYDSFWIKHGNYLEDELVEQLVRDGRLPQQLVQYTFHHPGGVALSWMNSASEKDHFFILQMENNSQESKRAKTRCSPDSRTRRITLLSVRMSKMMDTCSLKVNEKLRTVGIWVCNIKA